MVNPGPFSAASLKLLALGSKAGAWKVGESVADEVAAAGFAAGYKAGSVGGVGVLSMGCRLGRAGSRAWEGAC